MEDDNSKREAKDAFERSIGGLAELMVQSRGDLLGIEELLVTKGLASSTEIDTARREGRRKLAEIARRGGAWLPALLADDPPRGKPQ